MQRLKRLLLVGLAVFFATHAMLRSSSVLAYWAELQWRTNPIEIYYDINPAFDTGLGVFGAQTAVDNAAAWWNVASRLRFKRNPNNPPDYNPDNKAISVRNFDTNPPTKCGGVDRLAMAWACWVWYVDPGQTSKELVNARVYFNNSGYWQWSTGTTQNCSTRQINVETVALHELGHMVGLHHEDRINVVMHPNLCTAWREPTEDDKHGAVMLYGPRTRWETWSPNGRQNSVRYSQSVAGYFNTSNPPPELGPRPAEFGVPLQIGGPYDSRYGMMAGFAQAPYSFAYFNLFTADDDHPNSARSYVTIQNGMELRWFQYNYQQSTISVDFEMTDGSTLRDSFITDQFGYRAHPAHRLNIMNQWVEYRVNLSALAGRTIKHWMIAYDNGGTGATGQFRAYFDQVDLLPMPVR